MTQSANASRDMHIDLETCDQEPIHTPGAIQPQGALLVAGRDDLIITHVSENLADFLQVLPEAALGSALQTIIGEEACRSIQATPASAHYAPSAVLAIAPPMACFPLQMVTHTANGSVYVELEAAPQPRSQGVAIQRTQAIMHALHAAGSQAELCQVITTRLRDLTGYDRVMVYQFDRNGDGEVVAEDCASDLDSYLGQHYPASDIPPQARRMYLAQRVRAIADVDYVPVQILADPALGQIAPIDMTLCALRSVSPAHREYMRNMGTQASLGVSLIPGTALWGLLVCHHRSPLVITPDMRAQCDLIGQLMSLLLSSVGEMEVFAERFRRQRALHEVIARMTELEHVADALLASRDAFLSMLDAGGAMIRLGERTVTLGQTPSIESATRAMTAMSAQSDGDLVASERLGECIPDWSIECASGALYLPLPSGPGDAVMWFRPEIERQINWGGDPRKAVGHDPATGRLSPRQSFAVWKERVAGYSAPWREADRAVALEVRRVITTAVAQQAITELAKLRYYDPLTQLPNRRMLEERLAGLGSASDVALLFVDLDRFKTLNDMHGHAAGDSMLLQVAARLSSAVRGDDLVARVGGDEFVLLCSKISAAGAEALAHRLRLDLAVPFTIDGQPFFAGGSIGVAHTDTTEVAKLAEAADMAMYVDKRRRRSRAVAPERSSAPDGQDDKRGGLTSSQRLERDLRFAVERKQLFVVYQPIVSSLTGDVVGFEALIRWQHPERGLILPLEFIPLAEESGLIIKIGRWILQAACEAAAKWNEPHWVAVNVSAAQFRSCDLPQFVSSVLADTGLPAHRLEIEITESSLVEAPDEAATALSELRASGVRLAIDDFGVGCSSLSYLHQFKFNKLKIDQNFVMQLGKAGDATTIVSAIIGLAHQLGLSVVAEGVETMQQLQALRDLGCDQMQGYLIGRPMPMDSPTEFLIARAKRSAVGGDQVRPGRTAGSG